MDFTAESTDLTDLNLPDFDNASNFPQASTSAKLTGPSVSPGDPTNREPIPQTSRTVDCLACADHVHPDLDAAKLPCNHVICYDCITRMAETAMKNSALLPLSCCRPLPLPTIEAVMGESFIEAYRFRLDELKTPEHQRVYCFDRTCSTFISPSSVAPNELAGLCQNCKKHTCTRCGERAHGDHCTEMSVLARRMQDATELAQGEVGRQSKKCPNPNCAQLIVRNEGCSYVKCTCGVLWCFDCGKEVKECLCLGLELELGSGWLGLGKLGTGR